MDIVPSSGTGILDDGVPAVFLLDSLLFDAERQEIFLSLYPLVDTAEAILRLVP